MAGIKLTIDFSRQDNIDCLVCHDWSNTYVKGHSGLPEKGVDLLVAAKSVGYPKRGNCGTCHNFGGGGEAVKHGDLDTSLDNPSPEVDVHMGKAGFLCIDCHQTRQPSNPGARLFRQYRKCQRHRSAPTVTHDRIRTNVSTNTWPR